MPYVEGESLRDRLRRESQLPVEEALQIATEVGQGARVRPSARGGPPGHQARESAAHARTAARWWPTSGSRGRCSGEDEHLTQTGISVGTPAYMSPEQAGGDRKLDARSDVYSLGCVLYEMLAGEPPYTGPTAQAIIAKRLIGPGAECAPAASHRTGECGSRRDAERSPRSAGRPVRQRGRVRPGTAAQHPHARGHTHSADRRPAPGGPGAAGGCRWPRDRLWGSGS